MGTTASKKKHVHHKNDNVLEALSSIPASVATNTVTEFSAIGGDIFSALIGATPQAGELKPNQAIEFGQTQPEQPVVQPQLRVEAYQKPNSEALEMETKQQLEAIRAELKALTESLKNLHQEVQTAVAQEVVQPGVYHLTFYEQLRTFIRVLRQQIEDSRTWLAAFTTRKKKIGYWGMFKKHGTSFGLSNERSLATSAG